MHNFAHGMTPRERDVMILVCDGLSNQQIAERLKITPKTVDSHISGIRRLVSASETVPRIAMLIYAIAYGLVPLDTALGRALMIHDRRRDRENRNRDKDAASG